MLVLSRRLGEAFVLDGGIRVVVISADRRGVRLGIEAPQEVRIQREELLSAPNGQAEPQPVCQGLSATG